MEKETRETNITPKTPESILRETALLFNELDQQAEEALIINKDIITRKQKLRQRAQLIVDLPSQIQVSIDNGNYFPESEMEDINFMASLAKKALKSNSDFVLGTLLESKGSETSDKNYLEELIDQSYPPK